MSFPSTDTASVAQIDRRKSGESGADPLMKPGQAAPYIGLAPSTLAKQRMEGTGPRYIRLSATRVAYRKSALDTWLAERERGSTLED